MPEWALQICRPVVGGLSRLLWRIRWIHTERIPAAGGLIIASNHQSYIDPFWIGRPVKRPVRFLAWDEAFDWPLVGSGLRGFGSLRWLREGGAMVIFPEGGRGNPDGSMRKFKAGAARIALEAGVPILPVTIRGGNRVWPSSQRFPRLGSVEIIYHPLFVIEQHEGEEVRDCARRETERLAEIVRSAL